MHEFTKIVLAALAILAMVAIPASAAEFNPAVVEAVRDFTSSIPTAHWYQMKPEVLLQKLEVGEEIFVVDCRRPDEYAAGHIEDAVNVPLHEVADHLDLLPEDLDTLMVVYCRSGVRSMFTTSALLALGYRNVFNMPGGYLAWVDVGYPVVK